MNIDEDVINKDAKDIIETIKQGILKPIKVESTIKDENLIITYYYHLPKPAEHIRVNFNVNPL